MIENCLENIEVCVQSIPDRYTLNILFNLQSASNSAFNQIVEFFAVVLFRFCGIPNISEMLLFFPYYNNHTSAIVILFLFPEHSVPFNPVLFLL